MNSSMSKRNGINSLNLHKKIPAETIFGRDFYLLRFYVYPLNRKVLFVVG